MEAVFMNRLSRTLALTAVAAGLVVARQARPVAQTASLKADFVKEWTGQKDTLVKIANAMPEDKFSFKAMSDSFDYGTALLNEQTDQGMAGGVQGPPWFGPGPSTRARIIAFLIGHTQDTYGQMVVYLRLNGLVPPASQRP